MPYCSGGSIIVKRRKLKRIYKLYKIIIIKNATCNENNESLRALHTAIAAVVVMNDDDDDDFVSGDTAASAAADHPDTSYRRQINPERSAS